jgi:hypothetical protein
MFSEQTLDVFLVSSCLRRIILRDLIIEIILDEGHMEKTRHYCATQKQSVRNTKPATAVLHRTNLSGTQKPPLLSHTTNLSEHKTHHCCATQNQYVRTQNPPLLCYTELIFHPFVTASQPHVFFASALRGGRLH